MSNYPEFMKTLPFCCWKWEGKNDKIPYDPKTGLRAKVNDDSTFGSYEEAIAALYSHHYSGIGIKISGHVGAIDIDKCIDEEVAFGRKPFTADAISKSAQKVIDMLPEAVVEFSPSRKGLHLFFVVPEGIKFDTDDYYINSRRHKMEVYLPGYTNRFLTVTGNTPITASIASVPSVPSVPSTGSTGNMGNTDNAANTGNTVNTIGMIKAEALQEFLDYFMKRPQAKLAQIKLPEGGSVLTDEEVLTKAKNGKNGEKFAQLYAGDWLDSANVNWSHSDADMSLCGTLAFYCRGDMAQMDRLFRASGLMRSKWDDPRGKVSYGFLTMNNAIAGCTIFYSREGEQASQVEAFKALIDGFLASERNKTSKNSKGADGADGADGMVEGSDSTAETVDSDRLLDDDALMAAAWAMKYDIKRWIKLRKLAQKKTSISIYEKQVRITMSKLPHEQRSSCIEAGEPLVLTGIDCQGFVVPSNWRVNDKGISFIDEKNGVDDHFSERPVFISSSQINVDDDTEKMGITFKRKNRYKTIIVPRADMLVSRKIVDYANTGLPVKEKNAPLMTEYIADFEAVNDELLVLKRCINRAGWVGNEFFPYCVNEEIVAVDDEDHTLANIKTEGSEKLWMALARDVRKLPFARAMLAASFASPLIEKLKQRIIYYHCWGNSRSGKTATLLFAMSIWGNPKKLMKTYTSTIVGMEHRAGMMRHLPLALDEIQNLDKKISIGNLIYELGNGVGKVRGRAGGGNRATDTWKNCILSTGEQPIANHSTMDGINTRLLEVNAEPIDDPAVGKAIHQITESNYGFAGPKYIRFLIDEVLSDTSSSSSSSSSITDADADTTNADNGADDVDGTAGADNDSDADSDVADNDVDADGMDDADENSKRPAWMLIAEELELKGTASRLIKDFKTICSTLAMLYDENDPQFDNIAVLALADYYSSISVFGLSEKQALQEAASLGGAFLEKQLEVERRDVVDRAWDFVCGWVARNKNKFESETISPAETYGKIENKKFYVIANILNSALVEAHFSDTKSVKGFADRGYVETIKDSGGRLRNQQQKKINGVNSRAYVLNINE